MFTLLPPDGKIKPHRDPYAGSLRYHLGLITPNSDDCTIFVDGQPYSWRDGKAVMFDETFVHSAYNKTEQQRLILFCDIDRPLNNPIIRALNRFIANHVMAATSSPNFEGDKTGGINVFYQQVHKIKEITQQLKRKNKYCYEILKYGLVLTGLYWIVWI
jgi:beta-hydroxylase